MFLKVLKEKSNQKFIEKTLASREVKYSAKKIKSVGVLLHKEEFYDHEAINDFFDELDIPQTNRDFFTFMTDPKDVSNSWDNVCTPKDFGWSGKLKTQTLKNFTEKKYDVLICYFLDNNLYLKQIAACSKARFKIGISNNDNRLYDLIIETKQFSVFKTELKKYLNILKKL